MEQGFAVGVSNPADADRLATACRRFSRASSGSFGGASERCVCAVPADVIWLQGAALDKPSGAIDTDFAAGGEDGHWGEACEHC